MGRLIVSMQLSVDGYIDGPGREDGAWVKIDAESHAEINRLAAGADALLYGRKVFDFMIPYWPEAAEDGTRPAHEQQFGRIFVDKPKIVFSRTLDESRWNTRVFAGDLAAEVARLKLESKHYLLCFGGAEVHATLQQAGLVDEYLLFVNPSAFGSGKPFFRHPADLRLLATRQYASGLVGLLYAPAERSV